MPPPAGRHALPRLLSRAILLAGLSVFLVAYAAGGRAGDSSKVARDKSQAAFEPAALQGDSSSFSHTIEKHASLACDSCHRRENNSAQPTFPGHKACTDCHIQEFTTSGSPLCMNCHTNVEGSNPPLKSFPGLSQFNMRFDHAAHTSGAAQPERGCASCHAPARRGVALTIPAGLAAHNNCYSCHTPGANSGGRDISSCSTCHQQGGYHRTGTGSRAYSVSFSHAAHGARQGLSCAECHQVRAGAPQSRQVSAPAPTQHFGSGRAQSCMTCHNNRRAFGGDDFADCKRCHKGQTFRF